MRNNKYLFYTALVILISFLGVSCSSVKHSQWQNHQTNGKSVNTSKSSFSKSSSAGMMYRIANDYDSLYIDLEFTDRLTRAKVLGFGFTVWVDPNAGNKKVLGIQFPLKKQMRRPGRGPRPEDARVKEDEHGMLNIDYSSDKDKKNKPVPRLMNKELKLIGFSGPGSVMKEPVLHSELNIDIQYERGQSLSYHLSMPLEKIADVMPIRNDSLVSIGFETGHAELKDRNNRKQRPAIGGGGGMHPAGGGTPPAYTGGQGISGRQHPFAQPTSVWLKKVKLASGAKQK